jgi:hypothetical protein
VREWLRRLVGRFRRRPAPQPSAFTRTLRRAGIPAWDLSPEELEEDQRARMRERADGDARPGWIGARAGWLRRRSVRSWR